MHTSRVATTYVTLLYEFLSRQGLEPTRLLGPMPDDRERPYVTIPAWRHMLELAEREVGGPAFGLRVGRCIGPRHFGLVGYLVLACASLGEALARAERYAALVYDVNPMQLQQDGGDMVLQWGTEYGRPGQLVDETGLAALVQMARDITGADWPLVRVAFVNPAPPDRHAYEDFFGCPVTFDAARTELRFPAALLGLPLRRPDAGLLELLDRQAEAMLARQAPAHDHERYRRALVPLLRQGRATLAALAAQFHVSPRTLQRQLAAAGTSFQILLDDTRRALACEYLADSRLSVADVAVLLGYSEQSAFTRAFRQWLGETPARWRGRHAGGGRGHGTGGV